MADVSGPTSTLPGSSRAAPDGLMCDDHQDRPAVRRVQGETDSFGAEYFDLCQECFDKLKEHEAENRPGRCDWCGQHATDLRPRRDIEEGMTGRVYDVCGDCVRKEYESIRTCCNGCNGCDECTDYEDQPDEPECPRCHGDGMDQWNDYLLPCPLCLGDRL